MKKAVISSGGQQFLVAEGDQIAVDRLSLAENEEVKFTPLLVIDDSGTQVGRPSVDGATVLARVVDPLVRRPKIVAIRFRAKKRIHKRRGQRPQQTTLKISRIELSAAKSKTAKSEPAKPVGRQNAKN